MELVTAHGNLIFWMILMFAILLFILKKYAWKPILKALKDREYSIQEALNSADKAKQEMEALNLDNKKIINDAKKERDLLLKEAKEIKEKIILEAKENAQQEALKIQEVAKQIIENEKLAAIEEMKNQIAILSIEIAKTIIEKQLSNPKENNEIMNNILKDIKLN